MLSGGAKADGGPGLATSNRSAAGDDAKCSTRQDDPQQKQQRNVALAPESLDAVPTDTLVRANTGTAATSKHKAAALPLSSDTSRNSTNQGILLGGSQSSISDGNNTRSPKKVSFSSHVPVAGSFLDRSLHSLSDDEPFSESLKATRLETRRDQLERQDSADFFLDEESANATATSEYQNADDATDNATAEHSGENTRTFRSLTRNRQRKGRKGTEDASIRNISLHGRDHTTTRMSIMVWEDVEDDDATLEANNGSIPSWSKQDRYKRALVIPKRIQVFCGSSVVLGLIFAIVYLLPEFFRDPEGSANRSIIVISVFIFVQTFVTLIAAIPGEDSTNEEVNRRVNASILIAMTLYPCLGLWMATRPQQLNSSNVFQVLGIDHFWTLQDDVSGSYQWGYIFPFFFWSTSACILLRDSNFAFTLDRQGVVSDSQGKAMTALFRRNPSFIEVWTHRITRCLTFSLWSIIPTQNRPAGGAGRFAFQLIAPFVLVFFYVGYRFVAFATDEMKYIINNPSDYTRIYAEIELYGDGEIGDSIRARFIVWAVFSLYCIIIRSVVGTRSFLSFVVSDPQSYKNRWVGWSRAIVETKRRRVLWAFRGLAYAFAPFYLWKTGSTEPNSTLERFTYYLYFCVYVSFFCEGVGAVFFGLAEAEKGCKLRTPFVPFTELWFWCAFNGYLQPVGTLINIVVWATNKEYQMKLRLREILTPVLLKPDNTFRYRMPRCLRKKPRQVTQEELDERLDEWIATWRRKRNDSGRDDKAIAIKTKGKKSCVPFIGEPVFMGTLFPTHDEWLYMRDHYDQYVPLLSWEQPYGPEKFLRWYPTYREEVISLLSKPYDFKVRREVWMFGYGSLISAECPPAGLNEDQKKQIIPYWLKKQAGYRRVWNYRHGAVGINAFGLDKVADGEDGACNVCGCIYPMEYERASDLFSFREEGYELLLIDEDFFEPMHPDFVMPQGVGYLWVCGRPLLKCGDPSNNDCSIMACKRHNPTADSPILQSYIDTVIEGALRFSTTGRGHVDGMNFAAAILSSTAGWNYPWYNDRLLSGRPWSYLPNYELIDGLLSTCPTSRDAFVRRFRTSIEPMTSKIEMFEREKDATQQWADKFYPKAPNFTESRLLSQRVIRNSTLSGGRTKSYADRIYEKSIKGSGALSTKAKNRMVMNQSMITGSAPVPMISSSTLNTTDDWESGIGEAETT